MAKFYGAVGYAVSTEVRSGIWQDVIHEHKMFGDVVRNSRLLLEGEKQNNDLTVQNSISVVADAYIRDHFFAIRYVEWAGALWRVTEVTPEGPRLVMRLGGVYNGPRADPGAVAPGETPSTP